VVHLLGPLFPRHHRDGWPEKRRNPDATKESQIKHCCPNSGESDRRTRVIPGDVDRNRPGSG
jgi:hypothetical protein